MSRYKELYKNVPDSEIIKEISDCVSDFYYEVSHGVERIKPELENFSGQIGIIDSLIRILNDRQKVEGLNQE